MMKKQASSLASKTTYKPAKKAPAPKSKKPAMTKTTMKMKKK
jgi:hypothetical protein